MKLDQSFPLKWVPRTLDFDDWTQLEPLFNELEKNAATKDLRAWLQDWSEFESAWNEESSRRYVAMTCDTENAEKEKKYLHLETVIGPLGKPRWQALKKLYLDHPKRKSLPKKLYGVMDRFLANEFELDLFRIDLSAVVSKYIGETEKNLRRVFDAAEEGGAVLLFDEADALFGKRSEVKDSHDRYANVEISYLLQRMEAYRGLAILTTNMKEALDPAFLRRLRFVVQFPFPDQTQRAEIWRKIFPAKTPTDSLDIDRLARLSISGGNIRSIALNAAFAAADAGEPVRMAHLLGAARLEYEKLEKPLTHAELGDWK